jgi:hypothetical protein
MTKLVKSISENAREVLETFVNEDLLGAVVTESLPIIGDDGKIYLGKIILRLEDGRTIAIVPQIRGMCPWLTLDIHDGVDWRRMTVFEDYTEELRDNKKIEFKKENR